MTSKLFKLTETNVSDYLPVIFQWAADETEKEYHTCRPIQEMDSYEAFRKKVTAGLTHGHCQYVLIDVEENEVVGKISLFDYNPRNRSGEFGYYVPPLHRGKGVGGRLIQLFLEEVFHDQHLNLHKVYATTAANNKPSIKLLERFNFKFEGAYREHYWFSDGSVCDQYHYSLLKKELSV
ncbi:GNAT family protein [Paenibacillus macerans]|uniref:Acetyltransferase family protein n=1 Tax=Paenibacillus macerans TaxID=44252 RepID=A0A090ZAW6_PAEMA|nr:GNAT family protein [Paenibacillus macerans]KFN07777.1 acetyltransferase family protein [Paenibacillus macerans]MBS5914749.1 GNAT family N-acetyltransferase [Paenibacillus macerans]MCY7562808.1 GNAT family N-acetyltransferase [Paenibacillus macerans]MEC0140211.1 GNAT family protein [Paenibacillus macerans]MEC0150468.1 GNAT family protein [Paenibacillus macerans]